jgi:hypothetical protein
MDDEQIGKMTALEGGTFLNNPFSFKFTVTFPQTPKICDEFLLIVSNVCRGLLLSILNLRVSYANHELLYASSLAVEISTS